MFAFNNDTKYILYNGHHNHIRIAYTAATTLTWSQSYPKLEDYKSCRSPDARYCGSAESVIVSLCSTSYSPAALPAHLKTKKVHRISAILYLAYFCRGKFAIETGRRAV